jgi:hypothetical protein
VGNVLKKHVADLRLSMNFLERTQTATAARKLATFVRLGMGVLSAIGIFHQLVFLTAELQVY